jgi:hypothetical protein
VRKNLLWSILLISVLHAAPASAAPITFNGYTTGCFTTTTCSPATSDASATVTRLELSYFNESFAGTTVAGELALNLGDFSLLPLGNDNYAGSKFNLRVSFVAPGGLSSSIYSSVLTGTTSSAAGQCNPSSAPCGSVTINFDNTPIPFSFTDGNTTGSFFLSVSDLTVLAGQTNVGLSGRITQADQVTTTRSAPESASLLLFGTGALALARRVKRDRRDAQCVRP